MKKLLKKSRLGKLCTIATALSVTAVGILPTCSTAVEQTTTSGTLEKVPYTVVRSNGASNSVGQPQVYNDGQFTTNSLGAFYYYNNKGVLTGGGYGGANTFNAESDKGVVIKFNATKTEVSHIVIHSGFYGDQKMINSPESNLKIRYSDEMDSSILNKNTTATLVAATTWTEVNNSDCTFTNITNGSRNIDYYDTLPYLYDGQRTYSDSSGKAEKEITYKEYERAQQIIVIKFKQPIKAGSMYIEYLPKEAITISEIELYNDKSGNALYANRIADVFPEIVSRDVKYSRNGGGYSAFGVTGEDGKGSFVTDGGISLTDGKKTTPSKADRPNGRNANRWFVNDTTAFGVPYVEYNMDGKTKIDQLVVYSGLLDESGNYKDVADAKTAYGAVDPVGVSVAYQDGSSDVWKTADIKIASDYGVETSNGTKLTINFGEITPTKLRLYAGIGTYASSTEPSAIFVKEIEAYDTEETNTIANTVDIIRADSGIKGDLTKRSKTTYVAKNSNKTSKSMSDITLTLSSAVEENAQITVTAKGSTKTQPTVGNTVLAEDKKSAYATISGLMADTTYEVLITGCNKVYTFTTAGDYVITKYGFDATEGNQVKVSYDIQKVGSGADNLIGIVAVYDNDGRVIGCDSVKMVFKGDEGNKCSGTLIAEIPAGYENTTAKAFLFKAESLSPVMEFVPKH